MSQHNPAPLSPGEGVKPRARDNTVWLAARQELRPSAVNTITISVGHVSDDPVPRGAPCEGAARRRCCGVFQVAALKSGGRKKLKKRKKGRTLFLRFLSFLRPSLRSGVTPSRLVAIQKWGGSPGFCLSRSSLKAGLPPPPWPGNGHSGNVPHAERIGLHRVHSTGLALPIRMPPTSGLSLDEALVHDRRHSEKRGISLAGWPRLPLWATGAAQPDLILPDCGQVEG